MSSITVFGVMFLPNGIFGPAQNRPPSVTQAAITSQPGYTIEVTGPKDPITVGPPIKVTVTVTNIASRDLYWRSEIGQNSAYAAFKFVLTRDGNEVETTFFHRKLSGRQRNGDPNEVAGGSSIVLAHPPGKMLEIPIDLTRLYKITEPGLYKLEVSRYDEMSKVMVRSNTLSLTIER